MSEYNGRLTVKLRLFAPHTLLVTLVLMALLFGLFPRSHTASANPLALSAIVQVTSSPQSAAARAIFLPALYRPVLHTPLLQTPRVNAPFLAQFNFSEAAIFWFGKVNSADNYADVRVIYTQNELWVQLQIFDRLLWYDATPTATELKAWDAVTLSLDLSGNSGDVPSASTYQITGMLNWYEPREGFQAARRGSDAGWKVITPPGNINTGWRGNAPNDLEEDRGWLVSFTIPFSSLGLSGPPVPGSIWGLALSLHDRDNGSNSPLGDKTWPMKMQPDSPGTWGQLAFGLPVYKPPAGVTPAGTTTIVNGVDGIKVNDGMVGGSSVCGEGLDFWNEWGETTYPGADQVNVQNQSDVADWPCFSKYYLTFPLDSLLPGKEILSATLKLQQIGNAGGGQWGESPVSLIQIMTVSDDWTEATLSWNTAPLAQENVSRAWVDPITEIPPGLPGVLRTWDLSKSVAEAYAAGIPLRIVLYSADKSYNTGRYFMSSDFVGWDNKGRPALEIVWGNP